MLIHCTPPSGDTELNRQFQPVLYRTSRTLTHTFNAIRNHMRNRKSAYARSLFENLHTFIHKRTRVHDPVSLVDYKVAVDSNFIFLCELYVQIPNTINDECIIIKRKNANKILTLFD